MRTRQAFVLSILFLCPFTPAKAETPVERGKYLVQFGGCNDCHSPGYFFGKTTPETYLSGSDVGFQLPDGTFVGPNLTPDDETGLGKWSEAEIITALQTGVRPDGRVLAPIMPWHAFAKLTKDDVAAVAAFLKSLKPVRHKVPGPLGAGEKAPFPVMTIIVPDAK
ncbi:cytochrome c [Rhizobium sp. ARZ01]|uniref:c-type cytochrome n=1 Tax=Rhizobium sp. ARZ01 TaxID=2769313 RepID=UPI00178406BD|nr:c-type cytochrome [Rhizobium sp. ARZ01]MBD9373172.1 cytochrome c [Rhizobium sp. ARZ01]